uniref:Ovule protein n=1 Tax=Panagrolaimus sp. PS1159 TaxID=55785 RepID=A0AC35F1K7_9BILA
MEDFQLSTNPSRLSQSMPSSSGFLDSTFARHDPINTTFLQQNPVREPKESIFLQSQAIRTTSVRQYPIRESKKVSTFLQHF